MAKGDHSRVEKAIDQQYGPAQTNLNNLQKSQDTRQNYLDQNYIDASNRGVQDYTGLQNGYNSLMQTPASHQNFGAYSGYQDFSKTGGYSPQDVSAIRARAIAPTRAVYTNAQDNIDRSRRLTGGYSPNYTAATAKLTRDLANSIGDQNTNVEAALADQIRQGKLAGLGGMTNIDADRMQENLGNRSAQLQAMGGATNLYGTAPGLQRAFANDMFQGNGNQLQLQGLDQNLANSVVNSTIGMSQVPGNFQSAMGNISSALGVGGQVAGMFMPGAGQLATLGSRMTMPTSGTMPTGGSGLYY